MGNAHLKRAFCAKNDEFYTDISTIHRELSHYREAFAGRAIVCPCNDAMRNFWIYLHKNFARYGLRKLIATRFVRDGGPSYALVYAGGSDEDVTEAQFVVLQEGGGYESAEVRQLIADADIVVTNPPFSAARFFAEMLFGMGARFLFICAVNLFQRPKIFRKICAGEAWSGFNYNKRECFAVSNSKRGGVQNKISCLGGISWLTNLENAKHCLRLEFNKKYDPAHYRHFDLFPEVLNVDSLKDIPCDYPGIIAVPITILGYYQPGQFEILDKSNDYCLNDTLGKNEFLKANRLCANTVGGKTLYERVWIKLKKPAG